VHCDDGDDDCGRGRAAEHTEHIRSVYGCQQPHDTSSTTNTQRHRAVGVNGTSTSSMNTSIVTCIMSACTNTVPASAATRDIAIIAANSSRARAAQTTTVILCGCKHQHRTAANRWTASQDCYAERNQHQTIHGHKHGDKKWKARDKTLFAAGFMTCSR